MRLTLCRLAGLPLLLVLGAAPVSGETGHDAWLRYAPLDPAAARAVEASIPQVLVAVDDQVSVQRARDELVRGLQGMLQKHVEVSAAVPGGGAIVLGTVAALERVAPAFAPSGPLGRDAFRIQAVTHGGARYLVIAGESGRAVLYGAFAVLRGVASGRSLRDLDRTEAPY